MTVAIDSNILFDILLSNQIYKDSSLELILHYSRTDRLIISEIVYSELASQFEDVNILDSFLRDSNIILEHTTTIGLRIASKAWKEYTRNRDDKLQCIQCGYKQRIKCQECQKVITTRQHIISDFLIGGHASEKSDVLLTRDLGFYRNYFKNINIINQLI
ncbi:MAG: nucleotide-binding protein [Halanaerobiaceae bacterium]